MLCSFGSSTQEPACAKSAQGNARKGDSDSGAGFLSVFDIGMLVRCPSIGGYMPCFSESNVLVLMERMREAKRRVRAKFPSLIEGSSGWFRAVANQIKKVRVQSNAVR